MLGAPGPTSSSGQGGRQYWTPVSSSRPDGAWQAVRQLFHDTETPPPCPGLPAGSTLPFPQGKARPAPARLVSRHLLGAGGQAGHSSLAGGTSPTEDTTTESHAGTSHTGTDSTQSLNWKFNVRAVTLQKQSRRKRLVEDAPGPREHAYRKGPWRRGAPPRLGLGPLCRRHGEAPAGGRGLWVAWASLCAVPTQAGNVLPEADGRAAATGKWHREARPHGGPVCPGCPLTPPLAAVSTKEAAGRHRTRRSPGPVR